MVVMPILTPLNLTTRNSLQTLCKFLNLKHKKKRVEVIPMLTIQQFTQALKEEKLMLLVMKREANKMMV